ncbi:MAG: hypothetical protein JW795_16670 [Chitinivibrionales bacterium]|nr:hypothetical protein [Chitinivibrionales bacterium]
MQIACDFYIVCLKKLKSGVILHGKINYDPDRGSMYFMKPRQVITIQDVGVDVDNIAFRGAGIVRETGELFECLVMPPIF